MNSLQHPGLLAQIGTGIEEAPLLSLTPLKAAYVVWAGVWVALVLALAAIVFQRRDL